MLSLRDLRRRIKSIENTQKITKAMKAVAAAKMRRAQEDVISARPYAKRLREVLGRVVMSAESIKHPLLEVRQPQKVAFLLITADRGLCGGFNSNLTRLASQEIKNFAEGDFICVGRKGRDFFSRQRKNIIYEYIGIGETIKIDHAKEIAAFVVKKYEQKELDVVYVIYSEFVNVLIQRPKVVKLLPIEPPAESGEVKKVDYIFEPGADEVMAEILPLYVENVILYALLESKASEQSARMTAMDNATENCTELISQLTLQMNKARQAAITKELLEIVSGAAALE